METIGKSMNMDAKGSLGGLAGSFNLRTAHRDPAAGGLACTFNLRTARQASRTSHFDPRTTENH